ncbi:hypothetical protein GWN42_16695 [candidate division KSB1 bacterium]|nr:hypothetical protein [candidate division KSB1 bacterium]NIR69523.1 hypothetical protein [candidate division KSB1 bacterium]NIS24291.1 hypothetical protein [candidate division KSB1 bacterium]NIU24910.1 hypothetical protein [candidate division KSB1 bacterium]NIU91831.1 hypothetical protein [candidate division KSB1 bacterium]
MLTDYLLAFVILVLSGRLFGLNQTERQRSIQLWNFGFVATALAALLGGTSHGFALYLNAFTKAAIWKGTVYAIGFASFFLLAGTIIASVNHPLRRWLLLFTTMKLLIYAGWMLTHDDFSYVIYDYVPSMVGVILLQFYAYVKRRNRSAVWLISGVLVSFASAGIQMSGFGLHEHFNHNDLYHVVQMGAMYLLYRGIRLLRDR